MYRHLEFFLPIVINFSSTYFSSKVYLLIKVRIPFLRIIQVIAG